MTNSELNQKLADAEGYEDVMDMLEEATFDSIVPAICTGCHATMNMEPDQDRGWCDECQKNTVKSCLILAGLI